MSEREPAPLPDDLRALLDAERRRPSPSTDEADRVLQRVAASVAAEPKLLRPRPIRRFAWVPLVAAAAGLLVLSRVHAPGPPALPSYDVELVTRDVTTRSSASPPSAAGSVLRQSGADFELQLRPVVAVSAPVEARAFTVRDGLQRSWRGTLEVSPKGAVRVRGSVADVFEPPHGRWEVVVAIGPTGGREPSPSLVVGTAERGEGWDIFRRTIELP